MKPYRSARYLAWIRTLSCVVCQTDKYIEAAHTGPHGMNQKAPDTSAIPLCGKHHQLDNDSYLGNPGQDERDSGTIPNGVPG